MLVSQLFWSINIDDYNSNNDNFCRNVFLFLRMQSNSNNHKPTCSVVNHWNNQLTTVGKI